MNRVRKSIESLYTARCDVIEYQELQDPVTKITKHQEVVVLENLPCKLSYYTPSRGGLDKSESAHEVIQATKLFIAPEIRIKPGSKIIVTLNGITADYERSGEPAIYPTHQEIGLQLFSRWA